FCCVYAVAAASWLVLRRAAVPLGAAIVIAVVLRGLFLFAEPKLSADVYRYLWDGREFASGRSPYARPPLDDARINHPEIPTIYPPHAELLFAVAHTLPLWRLLLMGCDVALIVLMRRHRLAIATFPPLVFEGAWSGHVEVVAALLLAVAYLRDSGAAGGWAAGVKVIPLAALPALVARSNSRTRFAITAAAAVIIPAIPFLIAGPLMPGMRDYATRWIFNSPAYDLVFAAVDRLAIKDAWTAIKDPLHLERISDWVYRHVYSDFVTRAVLAVIAIVLIIIAAKKKRVADSVGALLIVSPAIHPWYWLVAAPVAMLEGSRLYVALALCAPFSYLLYDGAPKWAVYALCYAVPLISLLRPSASGSSGAGSR
ncbi:MAG TPA: glycosyltransferase 87 family protein, partial [Thermoanaerobaculia bacterium]|nr:glycosyltransferase 87 family protein [Thermoanaerobaculia bacterium]